MYDTMDVQEKRLIPLLGMTPEELEAVASEVNLRRFAAGQMARRLYVGRVREIGEMTELPVKAREALAERYCVGRSEPVREALSADGTAK